MVQFQFERFCDSSSTITDGFFLAYFLDEGKASAPYPSKIPLRLLALY